MAVLKTFGSANVHLINTLDNIVYTFANELRIATKNSIGENCPSIVLQIQQLISAAKLVNPHLKNVDKK